MKIMARESAVLVLVDVDAQLAQVSLTVLADILRNRIVRAIDDYREERRPDQLLRDALIALAPTAALALAGVLVVWLTRRLDALGFAGSGIALV